jgi:CHAT domain-containing protein
LEGQVLTAGQVRYDRAAAFGLYQDLVAPVEGALVGVKRLYTVTSGSLGDLPLSVLMTRAPRPGSDDSDEALADPDTPWLIERYALSTLPSVSSLGVRGREGEKDSLGSRPTGSVRVAGTVPFVGYGAPVLFGSGGPARGPDGRPATGTAIATFENGHPLADPQWLRANFGFLTGPLRELPRMAAELGAPRGSVHLEAAATEQAIKADASLADARIVAFATHGFLPGQVPGISEPGLVFTPPTTASLTDDGVLTASEASSLRFTADWIFLSACDTASSDGQGAEGLSSLSRAFLYAGARALLASHWPVDDAATAALTSQTLALRQANPSLTRSQALQQAMRIIRTGRMPDGARLPGWSPRWANPARWGGFTIITNQDQ